MERDLDLVRRGVFVPNIAAHDVAVRDSILRIKYLLQYTADP